MGLNFFHLEHRPVCLLPPSALRFTSAPSVSSSSQATPYSSDQNLTCFSVSDSAQQELVEFWKLGFLEKFRLVFCKWNCLLLVVIVCFFGRGMYWVAGFDLVSVFAGELADAGIVIRLLLVSLATTQRSGSGILAILEIILSCQVISVAYSTFDGIWRERWSPPVSFFANWHHLHGIFVASCRFSPTMLNAHSYANSYVNYL